MRATRQTSQTNIHCENQKFIFRIAIPEEIVIETRGKGTGWRMIGKQGETVAEYAQTYTFRRDRIICGGELTWLYPHQTGLHEMAIETFFTPDAVFHPVHLLHGADQSQRKGLALTTSHGQRLKLRLLSREGK